MWNFRWPKLLTSGEGGRQANSAASDFNCRLRLFAILKSGRKNRPNTFSMRQFRLPLSYMTDTRTCPLCDALFEPTELSHLVSKFAYRWLKQSSATGYLRYGPEMNRRAQDGLKDYFLCSDCEDRLSREESVFADKIFYPFVSDNSLSVNYEEYALKFAVGASWRVLAYANQKRGLPHLRGRHEDAVRETL